MAFEMRTRVRFADVDPAGIVFYPRYFEMLNAAVEDWFASDLGMDFATLHLRRRIGVPTVRLECDFLAPCGLGDLLTVTITPTHVGRSSCAVAYRISGGGTDRVRAAATLVCMDLDSQKSMPWPEPLRARLAQGLVPA